MGQPDRGDVLARFSGQWRLSMSEGGGCATVTVDRVGGVTADCAAGTTTYTLVGNVDAEGVFTAATSRGTTLTGNLSSPLAGLGNWRRAGSTGTWAASRL
jgi:hypothetical protein